MGKFEKLEMFMLRKPIFMGALLIMSVFLLTGCNLPSKEAAQALAPTPTTATNTATNIPTATFTPTPEPTLCDNLYQPSKAGATWVYTGSNTALESYNRTDNIIKSSSNAFTSENAISTVSYTVDYSCTEAGLIAENPVQQYLGALLNSPGSQISVKLISASGVSLPANIKPGDQWQQVAEVEANINGNTMNGWLVFDYTAVGFESLTVPSATYDALRVDATISIEVTPLRIQAGTYQLTTWMAPNVGTVKTESTSYVPGIEFSDSLELTSFTPSP
jgi:hypothetical protein